MTQMVPLTLDYREAVNMPDHQLRQAIAEYKVAVIKCRDAALEPYVDLMKRLGKPVHHILENFCLTHYREVLTISNVYEKGAPLGVHDGGAYWHTDMSYKQANTVLTSMLSVKVPDTSGETEFIDCVSGLQRVRSWMKTGECPDFIKELNLDSLQASHRFGNRDALRNADAKSQVLEKTQRDAMEAQVLHPLVIQHPLTGAHALYAAAATSFGITGWPDEFARQVLDTLFDFLLLHAPRYKHHYQRGDIVIWDNLSTLHRGPVIPKSEGGRDARLLYRMNVDFNEGLHHG
ncbi:TauD/TfdA dioxygenase family protein [Pseudomonas floridensis]|nr:TauD/TfdA family dioxygenase [Pseudomonas floridensis]